MVGRDVEPYLVLARGSRCRRVDRGTQRDAVAHDRLAGRARKPADDPRDPDGHGSAADLQRNDLLHATGELGQPRSGENGGRRSVGGLRRPKPGRALQGQGDAHADTLPRGTNDRTADADPLPQL